MTRIIIILIMNQKEIIIIEILMIGITTEIIIEIMIEIIIETIILEIKIIEI